MPTRTIRCSECQEPFTYDHTRGRARTTCSFMCKKTRISRRARERYQNDPKFRENAKAAAARVRERTGGPKNYKVCPVCGDTFLVLNIDATICSPDCIPGDLNFD